MAKPTPCLKRVGSGQITKINNGNHYKDLTKKSFLRRKADLLPYQVSQNSQLATCHAEALCLVLCATVIKGTVFSIALLTGRMFLAPKIAAIAGFLFIISGGFVYFFPLFPYRHCSSYRVSRSTSRWKAQALTLTLVDTQLNCGERQQDKEITKGAEHLTVNCTRVRVWAYTSVGVAQNRKQLTLCRTRSVDCFELLISVIFCGYPWKSGKCVCLTRVAGATEYAC